MSLSCSRFGYDGDVVVMNRNYDLLIFEVSASEKFVGYYNLNPKVYFTKVDKK